MISARAFKNGGFFFRAGPRIDFFNFFFISFLISNTNTTYIDNIANTTYNNDIANNTDITYNTIDTYNKYYNYVPLH